jgi:hypothetical protein
MNSRGLLVAYMAIFLMIIGLIVYTSVINPPTLHQQLSAQLTSC